MLEICVHTATFGTRRASWWAFLQPRTEEHKRPPCHAVYLCQDWTVGEGGSQHSVKTDSLPRTGTQFLKKSSQAPYTLKAAFPASKEKSTAVYHTIT